MAQTRGYHFIEKSILSKLGEKSMDVCTFKTVLAPGYHRGQDVRQQLFLKKWSSGNQS